MKKTLQKDGAADDRYSNKVFQTIACLEEAQRKRLTKYFHSPYFLQSRTLMLLCELLVQEIDLGKTGFNREEVWQKIFPNVVYDDVNFRKYCSDLLKYTQDFMAHELLAKDPIRQSIDTVEFIGEYKIEPLYKSGMRDARNLLESRPFRSMKDIRSAYLLERHYFSMMDFGVKVDTRANLEEISNNLDLFYWIEKLKICSSALSQQRTGNQQYDIRFADDIIAILNKYQLEDVPELAIYYYSFLTLKESENVEHYYKLRRLLDKYGTLIPQADAVELIDSALHYCTGKINTGHQEFYQEYFDLFEDTLEKGVFFVKGELATWRFNNMIAAALRLGKLEWAEKFIQNYHIYLSPDTRENTYSFNLARVYRFQGKYENVLELLQNIDYEDTGYNLISKAMLIITYFELGEFDTLLSFTTSFKAFLIRHKDISKPRRQGYLNLVKYTRHLIQIRLAQKTDKVELREEIIREKAVTVNHEWLLEKLT